MGEIQRVDIDNVPPHTRRLYLQASLVALLGNALLVLGKGAAALVSGSSALYADAANSAADVAYSLLMGVGLWLSLQPPDPGHPHGHRRIESLVSLFIGGAMMLAGVEAVRVGWRTWVQGPQPITSIWAYIALVATVLAKGGMFLVVRRLGQRANSPAILASARDNLSDVISSAMALVGILGSIYFFAAADPLAAFVVAAWIFYSAWIVLRESISHLIGGAAPPELTDEVVDAAMTVPGVLDVHQVIIEYVGPQVRADMHIDMDGQLTLDQVHAASDAVREAVEALAEVDHAFVHVEPAQTKMPESDLQQ